MEPESGCFFLVIPLVACPKATTCVLCRSEKSRWPLLRAVKGILRMVALEAFLHGGQWRLLETVAWAFLEALQHIRSNGLWQGRANLALRETCPFVYALCSVAGAQPQWLHLLLDDAAYSLKHTGEPILKILNFKNLFVYRTENNMCFLGGLQEHRDLPYVTAARMKNSRSL